MNKKICTGSRVSLALAVSFGLLLTGCSTGGASDSSPEQPSETTEVSNAPEITDLTVGTLPYAELAGFYHALESGYFEEEGFESVEAIVGAGGAVQIPGLVSGSVDITYTSWVTMIQAVDSGIDLAIVRENDKAGVQGIFVSEDSPIEKVEDLEGATIAVTPLGGFMDLTSRAVVDHNGVDAESVTFVELPPQDMFPAIQNGNVDAAWLVEPFVTVAKSQNARMVVSAFEGPTEDVPVAGFAALRSFTEENPKTVEAFTRALERGIRDVAGNQELAINIIPTYSQINPDLAAQMEPSGWAIESEVARMAVLSDLMLKFGLIDNPVDVESLAIQ